MSGDNPRVVLTLAQLKKSVIDSLGDTLTEDDAAGYLSTLDELIAYHGPDWRPPVGMFWDMDLALEVVRKFKSMAKDAH